MSSIRTAQRYAMAIFSVAEEKNIVDVVEHDFEILRGVLRDSREFSLFIKSPIIKAERKKSIINTLLRDKISDLTYTFIILLVSKNREFLISEIIEQFMKLHDEARGILNTTIRTAIKLNPRQEEILTKMIADATRKKLRVKFEIDATLRGGFKILYEDTVVDASVQNQLDRLRIRLSG